MWTIKNIEYIPHSVSPYWCSTGWFSSYLKLILSIIYMNDIIDNIIIGAGPAGLQLGYFFEKNSINYLIFEKNDICGSFFSK